MKSILRIDNLSKHFPIRSGVLGRCVGNVYAVNGVSFTVEAGETLGIVGESGCGKSTLGYTIMQLYKPTSGKVYFGGEEISNMRFRALKRVRKKMQMIFQDPYSSFDPRMNIREVLTEPFKIHAVGNKQYREEKVTELLDLVGLNSDVLYKYPQEFSGGQRQRIGIARALMLNPELVIADEPVSALDVSIQSQVLNLLKNLQRSLGLTYVFIAHNLAVVKYMSDKIAVMYLGQIVEMANHDELYAHPMHPYTQALISAIPAIKGTNVSEPLTGEMPKPSNPPNGCKFHTRCKKKSQICVDKEPELRNVNSNTHSVRCHLV